MSPRLVACALLLAWPLQPLDDAVRTAVLAHRPAALAGAVRAVNDHGRTVLLPALGVAFLCGAAARAVATETVVALAPVNLVVEGLKWTVNRTRPDGGHDRRNSSFPSSHAANAITVATVLGRRWRWAAIPAWLGALFVAYARMSADRHWFSDVLGSAAIAVGGALFAHWIMARWRSRRVVSAST